jgi:hypothetical protein
VDVSWSDDRDNEAGLQVWRRNLTEGLAWERLATEPANAASFEDRTVQPGIRYRYHIRACYSSGCSEFDVSNLVTVPSAASPPVAPSEVVVGAASSVEIEVSWIDNSDDPTAF